MSKYFSPFLQGDAIGKSRMPNITVAKPLALICLISIIRRLISQHEIEMPRVARMAPNMPDLSKRIAGHAASEIFRRTFIQPQARLVEGPRPRSLMGIFAGALMSRRRPIISRLKRHRREDCTKCHVDCSSRPPRAAEHRH